MNRWQEYHTPRTVDAALALLDQHKEQARIIAGGTDLILDMGAGHTRPVPVLVDVTKIDGFDRIAQEEGWLLLGAGVTHAQIERSPILRQGAACLAESCGVVGGPQVRNVATLGGNVAHALPAADGTVGLLALDAQVEICTLGPEGVRREWQPLLSIFAGPGRNTLAANQLLSAFRFRPTGPGEASAFDRVMRPQGVALPILGVAARVHLRPDGQAVAAAAIAIGPAGPVPFRASGAEAALTAAETFDPAAVDVAVAAAQAQAKLRTSRHRATRAYRHEMLAVLLRRVLFRAVARARKGGTSD